jgi:hypothetical protein
MGLKGFSGIGFFFLFAFFAAKPCLGKVVQSSVVLSLQKPWAYFTKFGFQPGVGFYGIRLRLSDFSSEAALGTAENASVHTKKGKSLMLTMEAHLDEEWPETSTLPFCERKSAARKVREVELPLDGSWGSWIEGNPRQTVRPHVWYYALQDCNGRSDALHLDGQDIDQLRVEVEFHAQQEGGSEFSVELHGTPAAAAIRLLLGTAFLAWYAIGCRQHQRIYGRLHDVLVVLFVAISSQALSYAFQWRHLEVYRVNGHGVWLLDTLSEIFSMLGQIIVSAVGIFLAKGYTVLPRKLVPWQIMMQAFLFVAITHVAIVAVSKFWDDASFKFHANEGVCGILLVLMRLALYACFVLAIRRTYAGASASLHAALAVQYLAYPVVFIVAHFLAPYLRHKFMIMGLFAMEAWSIMWYARMFLTKGNYFDITTLERNLLPTPNRFRRSASFRNTCDNKVKFA